MTFPRLALPVPEAPARPHPEPLPLPWSGEFAVTAGGWTLAVHWAVIDGIPEPWAIGWESDGTAKAATRAPLPAGVILRHMREAVEQGLHTQAGLWESWGEEERAAELRELAARSKAQRAAPTRSIDIEHLRAVAKVYNGAKTKPAQAVYLAFPTCTARTLDRHIRRARDLGYIERAGDRSGQQPPDCGSARPRTAIAP